MAKLDGIKNLVNGLIEGNTIDPLLQEWISYESLMLRHLQHEEDVAVPLMRAYFTKRELQGVTRKLIQTNLQLGSFIHAMSPQVFRNDWMAQEGIPTFVWGACFYFQMPES